MLERYKKYNRENKEKISEKNAKHYALHRSDRIQYSKDYRLNNLEKSKDSHRRYRINNRDKVYERNKKYYDDGPGKILASRAKHKRRDIESNLDNTLTLEQWEKILSNQGNKCAICGKRFCKSRPPTKDHIIPVSKGGGLTFENVQALCKSCNCSKGNKIDYSKVTTWGVYS
jgi:5-methylcytosine-specific restriction endonuclease McrA